MPNSKIENIAQIVAFIALILTAIALIAWDFKIYGDIFRFILPILCAFAPFYERDFEKLKELIFAILISSLVVYVAKFGISYMVANYDVAEILSFARRPINGKYTGFPSGHTQGAFIAVAFAFVYFHLRWKILLFCLATLVGISRIYSEYHTILQMICGGIIGFFVSYFVIKFLQNRRI
ncbi:phosphatase PAP2 family protein [Helicobacter sp. 23-1044]